MINLEYPYKIFNQLNKHESTNFSPNEKSQIRQSGAIIEQPQKHFNLEHFHEMNRACTTHKYKFLFVCSFEAPLIELYRLGYNYNKFAKIS